MRIRHILLTKFNCDLILENKVLREKASKKKLDDGWLRYRWQLFINFTVPSICAQTNNDFDWIVLFDKLSPNWLREEAEKLILPCRKRFSFYDFGSSEFFEAFKDLNDPKSYDVALTTIIDSDDAFHRRAIERIRNYFLTDPHNIEVLNFDIGYQYNIKTQQLAIICVKSPPFSTMVNVSGSSNPFYDSIFFYGGDHTKLPEKYKYYEISFGDPMYVQIIHGDNIANKIAWNAALLPPSLSRRILKAAFNIDVVPKKITFNFYKSQFKQFSRFIKNNLSLQYKHKRPDLI